MARRTVLSASFSIALLVSWIALAGTTQVVQRVRISGPSPYAPNGCTAFGSRVNHEGEVAVAVNPTNQKNIVATWMQDPLNFFGASGIMIASSHDGGASWTRRLAPGLTVCGAVDAVADPHVSFGSDGTLYLVALGQGPTPTGLWAITASTSSDGGSTWSDPITLGQGANDFPTITTEPDVPGAAIITWSARADVTLFSRTTDGGRTWSQPGLVRLTTLGYLATNRVLAMLDGTLVVVLVETRAADVAAGTSLSDDAEKIIVIRSSDKGASWSEPVLLGTRSLDFDNIPTAAVGPDGSLYAAWRAPLDDGSHRLVIARSRDAGATWTSPTIVATVPANERFDALAVDGAGTIGLLWYATSTDAGGATTAMVHLSHSHDGGSTWADMPLTGWFSMELWLGDYQELVGLAKGFVAAFAVGVPETSEGTADVLFARVTISKTRRTPKPILEATWRLSTTTHSNRLPTRATPMTTDLTPSWQSSWIQLATRPM